MKNFSLEFTPTTRHDTYSFIDPTKADLTGKYVLVTGASKGIGRATSISYAKAGVAGIAILARSDLSKVATEIAEAAKAAGHEAPKVVAITTDVTSRKAIEEAAAKVDTEFGKLDILINNAGYLEKWLPIAETDPDEWWKTYEINIRGVYLMNRFFIPLLLKGNLKIQVALSSAGAHFTTPGGSAYQSTKTGVIRLNEFLMAEYGEQGLIAFAIHPGGVGTELAYGMPEFMHAILEDTPELAGDTLVFLTKERQEWLSDRYFSVNWDMQELWDKKNDIISRDLLKLKLLFE